MTGWLISTLLATTALMLLVLAIRRPVARHLGARAAYALWLLPALRMVLPPLPEALAPVGPALPANLDLATLVALGDASSPVAEAGVNWLAIVAAVWLAVALLRFALPFVAYRRFMREALAKGRALGRERGVAVHLSGRLAGPLAAGVFRRRIVLPHDFHRRFDPAEQALALRHEAVHHARRDTIANVVALAVLALHWWNPVAHIAWRAFRADQELACDAIVLAGADDAARHAYGSALVKAAFGGTPAAACGMGRAAELKQRLRAMQGGAGRPTLGAWLAAALVAGGLVGTATGSAAAEKVRAFGEQVREALPAVPDAPRVPFAPEPPAAPRAPLQTRVAVMPQVIVDGVRYATAPAATLAPPAPLAPVAPPMPPIPPEVSGPDAADRAEIAAAAQEARAGGMAARREALADAAEARREALADAAEARREAGEARHEALQAAAEARAAAPRHAAAGIAAARSAMADACAARGLPVTAAAVSMRRLATCDGQFDRALIRSLEQARRQIDTSLRFSAEQRARALAGINRSIARLRAER